MSSEIKPGPSGGVVSPPRAPRANGRGDTSLLYYLSGGSVTGVISRGKAAILALLAGCIFIGVLTLIFPKDSFGAALLLEHSHDSPFPYPFTIQNMIHLLFFVGLGELFVRARVGSWETAQLHAHYLPEDEASVLRIEDLGAIRRKVAHHFDGDNGFLPSLINMAVLQLQSTRSIDQAVSVLQTSLGLLESKVEQRYAMVRYLAWVIPTMGFIGTVSHLGNALRLVDPNHMDISAVTTALAIAFNTTLVALIESAILVLIQHVVQTREDAAVGLAGEYCLKNLINRLYVTGP
jgi:biopolymer transport protein ExbB/TolQ